MHIGLIGGIGPAATCLYYRELIRQCAARDVDLTLTMAHAEVATLLENQRLGDVQAQMAIYEQLATRLRAAGATCLVIPSISGHFCLSSDESSLPLPVVDLIDAVNAEIRRAGYTRVGILGTRTAMVSGLFGRLEGVEVVRHASATMTRVHDAYVALATRGSASDGERAVIENAYDDLVNREGAEVVMLGGTDLTLVFDDRSNRQNVLDCAAVHISAVVQEISEAARNKHE